MNNQVFTQKMSIYSRLAFIIQDEVVDENDNIKITEENYRDALKYRDKVKENLDKSVKLFSYLIILNLLFSKGIDFSFKGISLIEIGGGELTSFLALFLSLQFYMAIMHFNNQQCYSILINTMQSVLAKPKGDVYL